LPPFCHACAQSLIAVVHPGDGQWLSPDFRE
jgi:hypothetical protein